MRNDHLLRWLLRLYTALVFLFVFAPIAASLVFSFNSDRFPTIPLGSFTTDWYVKAFSNPELWDAALRSLIVSAVTAVTSMTAVFGLTCLIWRASTKPPSSAGPAPNCARPSR